MSFSDFITDSGKRISKDNLINLIQVSQIDGVVSPLELDLIHRAGRKFGLTDPEIDNLILKESNHHYDPPYSLDEKFEQLFHIAEMALVDNVVSENEMKMMRKYAIAAGFTDKVIAGLLELTLEGIRRGDDQEKILKEFKVKLFK
jgi:hypothetical protein